MRKSGRGSVIKSATKGMAAAALFAASCTPSTASLTPADHESEYLSQMRNLHPLSYDRLKFSDTKESRDGLERRLEQLPHTIQQSRFSKPGYVDQDSGWVYQEDSNQVHLLTYHQFMVTKLIVDALQQREFIESVGHIIETDLQDTDTEHGGLILLDEQYEPHLVDIPSASKANTGYSFPESIIDKNPQVVFFHLHAVTDDCTDYAGPSRGDRGFCRAMAGQGHDFHCVVITKLEGNRFNIDFFGADYTSTNPDGENVEMIVLDLGTYEYEP